MPQEESGASKDGHAEGVLDYYKIELLALEVIKYVTPAMRNLVIRIVEVEEELLAEAGFSLVSKARGARSPEFIVLDMYVESELPLLFIEESLKHSLERDRLRRENATK